MSIHGVSRSMYKKCCMKLTYLPICNDCYTKAFKNPIFPSSMSRQNGEYSTWTVEIGWTAWARRRVWAVTSERPSHRGIVLSPLWALIQMFSGSTHFTSSAIAPTVFWIRILVNKNYQTFEAIPQQGLQDPLFEDALVKLNHAQRQSLIFTIWILNLRGQVEQTIYDTSLRPLGPIAAPVPASDDPEEWYGLKYTLEISSRERQPSDPQSFSAGEHSKVNFAPFYLSRSSSAVHWQVLTESRILGSHPSRHYPSRILSLKTKITIDGRTGAFY